MSSESVIFRSSVLIFFLLLFNGGSIALGAVPYFYGPAGAFQILQITMAGAAFILTLLLPCFVIAKRGRGVYTESIVYLVIALLDIIASVFTTLRWVQHNLKNDYSQVSNRDMVVIMVVCAYWAASLTGFIGFFLAMIDACSKAIRRDKPGSAYDQRVPPRELQSAQYASPYPFTTRTTYMRPGS